MKELVFKTIPSCSCKVIDTYRLISKEGRIRLYVNNIFISDDKEYIATLLRNIKEYLEEDSFNSAMKFLEESYAGV